MAVSSSKGDTYKDGSTVGWGIITIEHTRAQAMEIVKLHFQSYADMVAREVSEDPHVTDMIMVEFVEEALQKMTKPDHFTGDPDPEVPKRLAGLAIAFWDILQRHAQEDNAIERWHDWSTQSVFGS